MLCNALIDNFYLNNEELQEGSPSRQDGIDAATETTLRHYGAELVQKAGILLGCPQAVMVTGQVLLQRFYCKKSLKEYSIRVRPTGAAWSCACMQGTDLCLPLSPAAHSAWPRHARTSHASWRRATSG
jgi:hypothetical protein